MHVTLMIMSRRRFLRKTVNKYLDIDKTVKDQKDVLLSLSLSVMQSLSLDLPPIRIPPLSLSLDLDLSLYIYIYIYIYIDICVCVCVCVCTFAYIGEATWLCKLYRGRVRVERNEERVPIIIERGLARCRN